MAACECYIAMLKIDDRLQALNIEEQRVTVKPIKDLEKISLDDNCLGQIPRICLRERQSHSGRGSQVRRKFH